MLGIQPDVSASVSAGFSSGHEPSLGNPRGNLKSSLIHQETLLPSGATAFQAGGVHLLGVSLCTCPLAP